MALRYINRGSIETSEGAPHVCPACAQPQAQFELLAKNW